MDYLKFVDAEKINYSRQNGIGGSDIGTIIGANPYSTILDLYNYKVFGEKQEFTEEAKEKMYWGTVLENVVANEFSKRNNVKVIEIEMLKNKKHNFAIANIDRLIIKNNNIQILEVKTSGENMKQKWINGDIPLSYIYQVQWYMLVTGLKESFIACLIAGQKYIEYKIEYDKDLTENYLLPSAYDFWFNNVLKKIPPSLKRNN